MTFEQDLKRADKYEKMIMDRYQLLDVRELKEYQQIDIDFLQPTDTKMRTIELKVDFFPPKNFFFETECNGVAGAIMKTESDELWYYFVKNRKLYIFDTAQLQSLILHGNFDEYIKPGGDNSMGAVVPFNKALDVLHYEEIEL